MNNQETNYKTIILNLVKSKPFNYTKLIKDNNELLSFINENTPLLQDPIYKLSTKVYWILNNLTDFPKCKTCGKPFINKNVASISIGYPTFCSSKCNLSNKETMLKRIKTNLEKYGCEHGLQNKKIREKIDKTVCQHKSENPNYVKEIKEKAKYTCLEKYGDENYNNREKARDTIQQSIKNDNNYYSKINDKIRQTCLNRYNDKTYNNRKKAKETIKEKIEKDETYLDKIIEKQRQTCLQKYGVDNPLKAEEIREKIKTTCKTKYGEESSLKSKIIIEKIHKTCKERYGTIYVLSNKDIQEKGKRTKQEKYGDENYNNREKARETCLNKYGTETPCQNEEIKNKMVQHNKKKFGGPTPLFSQDILSKAHKRYTFDNIQFDSAPELALYIFLKDHHIDFEYHPNVKFRYVVKEKEHYYFPDFRVNDKFVEIKGDHFFNENNEMINPYSSNNHELYQAKFKCMIENKIIILRNKNYSVFISYVQNKYGKSFIKNCKQIDS